MNNDNKRQTTFEPLWTVEDVANYLNVGSETVRMMARKKKISTTKIGKFWRFTTKDIKALMKDFRNHPIDEH